MSLPEQKVMNLYEKINAIMGDVRTLQKDGRVNFGTTKYNFLSEAKTTEIFHDLLHGYKLVLLPIHTDVKKEGALTVGHYVYRLINVEAPEEFVDLETDGQGQDSGDKGSGKASSYAYKYLLWRTFAIPSNDDPDNISNDEFEAQELANQKAQQEKEAKRKKAEFEKTKTDAKNKLEKHPTKTQVNKLVKLADASDSDLGLLLQFHKVEDVGDLNMIQFDDAMKRYQQRAEQKELLAEAGSPIAGQGHDGGIDSRHLDIGDQCE